MCLGPGRRGRWEGERISRFFWVKKAPIWGELLNTSVTFQLLPGGRCGKPNVWALEHKWASHWATSSWWGCVVMKRMGAQIKNIWNIWKKKMKKACLKSPLSILSLANCWLHTERRDEGKKINTSHSSLGELECGAFWHKLSRRSFQKKQYEWEYYCKRPQCQVCAVS